MDRFLVSFGFDKIVVQANSIEEAFDFVIDEYGIFSDPYVRVFTVEDYMRFRYRRIHVFTVMPGYVTESCLLGRRNMDMIDRNLL